VRCSPHLTSPRKNTKRRMQFLGGERDQKACSLAPAKSMNDSSAAFRGEGWGEGTMKNTPHTKGNPS
jgi:hypothetical protein